MTEAAPPAEAWEGESQLTDEEKTRRLVLHFSFPRTLMTCDMVEGRSTEQELNEVLSEMAWGTEDGEQWILESPDPMLDPPPDSSGLISYKEFLQRRHPCGRDRDESEAEENRRIVSSKCGTFTSPNEPGQKFRPMYDQMVKCITFSKQVLKGYNLNKVHMNEEECPDDPSAEDWANIARMGRYQILPAFYNLLIYLTKEKRKFSLVFRAFGNEIPLLQRELKCFCLGTHPCYNGGNKTKKPPNMSGEKGSKDMRLVDEYIGTMDRMGEKLEFIRRNSVVKKDGDEEKKDAPTGEEAKDAAQDDMDEDLIGGGGPTFVPTSYEFDQNFHQAYAGLTHQILEETNTTAIKDDFEYWIGKDRQPSAGKLLMVDDAETKTQHIFFDGHIRQGDPNCVDVRNVVDGRNIAYEDAEDVYIHRVNVWGAITDDQYFVKSLAACELKMSQRIVAARKAKAQDDEQLSAEELRERLKALPPGEYLYKTVMPALLPALEVVQRDRPENPIDFLAFHLLRHMKQYQKTVKP